MMIVSVMAFIPACATQQSHERRVISATEHIENPIRTLEARGELEAFHPMSSASDELIGKIIPDALPELDMGSSAYRRALAEPPRGDRGPLDGGVGLSDVRRDEIDPQRRAQAVKLYTRARELRQRGKAMQASRLLEQGAKLDPDSASLQRYLGETKIITNDRVGALGAFKRAIELGDRSPDVLVHLAGEASARDDQERVIWLTTQALDSRSIETHPITRSIAGVLLGTAEINSGYFKSGAQTLEGALESFNVQARDLRWKREIIQILSQRVQLWVLVGDAWGSLGAHRQAQDAYTKGGLGLNHPPQQLVARQITSSLRQGHPARAALALLDHLQSNAGDLGSEELEWARALASIETLDDVLGPAISMLEERPGLTPSIQRSLLGIELSTLGPTRGLARLGSAGQIANDALVCLGVLSQIEDESERFKDASRVLESNPQIARAIATGLTRTLKNPVEFMHRHARPTTPGGQLLVASIGLGLGRADLIEHLDTITGEGLAEQSAAWIAVHAQGLALTGRWSRLSPLIDELRSRSDLGDGESSRRLASTLIIAQRPDEGWALIKSRGADADAEIEDLILGAQIAQTLNDYESAANFLERASERDPYNEKIYEQLFLLRSSSSPIGNEDELKFIVRQLGTNRPRSALFGLIRAGEMARNGLIDASESLLIDLNTRHPYREIGYDMLLSIWKTKQAKDNSQSLSAGVEWLESRLESDPNSIQAMMEIAQGLFELDAHQRSLNMLRLGYARTGSFELARAIEQLLSEQLDEPDEGTEHLSDRLDGLVGVDPTIEYAGFLAKQASKEAVDKMLGVLHANLPLAIKLLPAQSEQLTNAIFSLTQSVDTLPIEPELLDAISVLEERTPKLGFPLARLRLLLLAKEPTLDIDHLIDVIDVSVDQGANDDERTTFRVLAIQSLLGEDRTHEAIALVARMTTRTGQLDGEYLIETYQLLAAVGTNSDMMGVLDELDAHSMMGKAIELATAQFGTPQRNKPASTPDEQRGDLAYTAAVLASAFDRDEQSQSYYELALSYDPDHAWANNDYGYILAEKGERMGQAVEMLERAARLMPNEPSVIDSLAWVRYKLGMFEDLKGEDGQPDTPGAISLLTRANELDTNRENATIMLHLGDALWRGGYKLRANDAWLGAEDILRSRIRLLKVQENPNQQALESMTAELQDIRYRLQDAESNSTPKIAPLSGEPPGSDEVPDAKGEDGS